MNIKDTLFSAGRFWKDFSREKAGITGLAIILVFVVLGLADRWLVPFPAATEHWRDIAFWQDNPRAAPPAWTNWFQASKGAVSTVLRDPVATENDLGNGVVETEYRFRMNAGFDRPPRDMVVRMSGNGQVPLSIAFERPDGLTAELFRDQVELVEGDVGRISIERNCAVGVIDFVRNHKEELSYTMRAGTIKPLYILFSRLEEGLGERPLPLKGEYGIVVKVLRLSPNIEIRPPEVMVSGDVSGLLGTDVFKRDIFTGLVVGVRWALIIGILTSIVTVVAGILLAVIAAFMGGVIDWSLSRLYELIYLLPVLPFLIVVSAIFKPSIWTLVAIICLFFWVGPFKPAYSMALQIREETYIEASKGVGASKWRIMLRHIVPILLPFSFAQMALSIPGVIVYEASISLLGLGDATIVTWGQILNDALGQGAVINNLWWWVIPPGLMIALMGMSFAFLGTSLDKILHPKLRSR